jgi:uncharacterized protein (TIGR03546 family)
MLQQVIKFLKLLNSDVAPSQIAAGICFGMMLAFTPFWSLHNILVLFVICVFRVNIASTLVSMGVCALLAWGLDPYFIQLGEAILTNPEWTPLWTTLYQQDIWRLAHFNNTMTMGSITVSLALFIPVFAISYFLIVRYRTHFMAYINKLKVVQWLKASSFSQTIYKLAQ